MASKAESSAESPAGSSVASKRRRRRRRRPAASTRAGPRRRRHQTADENQGRQAAVSADRAVGAGAGRRDHRSDHRLDGRVLDAKVLRSIPLLDAAALDAVKQWSSRRRRSTVSRCRSS